MSRRLTATPAVVGVTVAGLHQIGVDDSDDAGPDAQAEPFGRPVRRIEQVGEVLRDGQQIFVPVSLG
ncbi:hypothetical protein [Variovorax sp. YR752]|uniref:hypothetical protein n=1 Tax=Variovorax sp. YR752 TaxID=1884383 RepID=UPI0031377CFD